MNILGIETSCDETSVAVLNDSQILSNIIYSQTEHEKFGGVVPELASRVHQKVIYGLCEQALERAEKKKIDDIDLIAVTQGPGLIGALLNGICFAKGLSYSLNVPIIGVNHLEGHLWASILEGNDLQLPCTALIVSGGHTVLLNVTDFGAYEIIGQTVDDAAGEAFDKAGKLMGLDYPAGPVIDSFAKNGDPDFYSFPSVKVKNNPFNFSFSGLKTAVKLFLESLSQEQKEIHLADICASFQKAVINELAGKTFSAAKQNKSRQVILAGGVAANSALKYRFKENAQLNDMECVIPSIKLCTDNGAMIAYAGFRRFLIGKKCTLDFGPKPRWQLAEL